MATLYARNEPAPDELHRRELAEAKSTLRALQRSRDPARIEAENESSGPKRTMGISLGPVTTGLQGVTTVRLRPVPTGGFHLLDRATDPLLTVTVKKESPEPRQVCVSAFIEG